MNRTIINPIINDTVAFVRTSEETGGSVSELLITLMPGGNNILHYHKSFTETFTSIEGTLGLELDGKKEILLTPGLKIDIPPLCPHRFFNPGTKPIKFSVTISPGHRGFEDSLRILYGLAADGLTDKKSIPKSLINIAVIGRLSDSYLTGSFKLMSPLFHYLAKKARKNGTEQKLIEKYCS
jgi:mannose-6-phosphate isomerase-like protein (cupin superfamily)